MKTLSMKRRYQAGLTAVELIVGIAVLALVLLYAVPKVNSMYEGKQEETLISDISLIVAGAKKMRGVRQNYSGVTCSALISDEYIAVPWSSCSGANPKGGNYTLAATGTNLTITATGLDASFCSRVQRAMSPTVTSATCSGGTLSVVVRG